jgi:hypothetical protein
MPIDILENATEAVMLHKGNSSPACSRGIAIRPNSELDLKRMILNGLNRY